MRKLYLTILISVTIVCVIFGTLYHAARFALFTGRSLKGIDSIIGVDEGDIMTQSYDISGSIASVDLDMAMGDVAIRTGDDFSVTWTGTEKSAPSVSLDGTELTVKQKGNYDLKDAFGSKKELVITIPSGTAFMDLDVKLDMGNLTLSSISATKAEIKLSKGNIKFDGASIGDLETKADMGNIEIRDMRAGSVSIEANMGNIEAQGIDDFSKLSIKADLGNVELDLTQKTEEFTFDLDDDLGNVKLNGEKVSSKYKQGQGSSTIEVDADMGNIHINTAG